MKDLLTFANAKTIKGEDLGFRTAILYMAPSTVAQASVGGHVVDMCPGSTPGCRRGCLFFSGRGRMGSVMGARIRKTHAFVNSPEAFCERLNVEIDSHVDTSIRRGLGAVVRLNGTTDAIWADKGIIQNHKSVAFYDYTKRHLMDHSFWGSFNHPNYFLTYSWNETSTPSHALGWLNRGSNVAIVISCEDTLNFLPTWTRGLNLVDGDEHDLRFLDAERSLIYLRAKGPAKRDNTSWVWRPVIDKLSVRNLNAPWH